MRYRFQKVSLITAVVFEYQGTYTWANTDVAAIANAMKPAGNFIFFLEDRLVGMV